jgi:hypothetical protein
MSQFQTPFGPKTTPGWIPLAQIMLRYVEVSNACCIAKVRMVRLREEFRGSTLSTLSPLLQLCKRGNIHLKIYVGVIVGRRASLYLTARSYQDVLFLHTACACVCVCAHAVAKSCISRKRRITQRYAVQKLLVYLVRGVCRQEKV